ncbi:hypothetical protein [Cellulomonas pakistanensis]|uniref:Peptidase S9 n=1 Tax=Cellulomonas pakistanensis TaxID=992287 RepID=A0A919P943_9CELL|nr:hypothetical protein [Cellulomonas pakistanensis]GIG34699.1 hypothetical protein Cpa01nite_00800 [Cellulomonas pakistanensis]
MPSTPPVSRVLYAAVGGLATTAYYATPDLIRSRAARGWAKTALAGVVLASSAPDLRRAREESRERNRAAAQEQGQDQVDWRVTWTSMKPRGRATLVAGGATALVASVGSVVLIERAVFRRGERRRAAGVRFAHTRPALVWGVLTTAIAFLPDDVGEPTD